MKSKEDIAIETFRSGLNCSQSVVLAYADEMSFDRTLALSMSCGFGERIHGFTWYNELHGTYQC